jgi:hypothetical protein
MTSDKPALIKTIYFYLVALIGLLMVVFSSADLVNIGLRTWVFPKADLNQYPQPSCAVMMVKTPDAAETDAQYQARLADCERTQISDEEARTIQKQKDAVRDISLIAVGIPLFLYHWVVIRKEPKNRAVA